MVKKNHWVLCCISFVFFVCGLLHGAVCFAEDKNGVSPNTVSLPSGPGSIEGLGESFQPMLNTGSARYSVNISLPPGINDHQPELSLQYESGKGNGPAGMGWSFGPGCISRKTDKGIPRYVDNPNQRDDDFDGIVDEADEEDIIVGFETEEMVRFEDNIYRARIEGSFVQYVRKGPYWEARLKNGTRLIFGQSPDARVTDAAGTNTFKWLLEKNIDVNGNTIAYDYAAFPGSTSQKYLREIRWGPGPEPWDSFYFVYFSYEDRPDWRTDYKSGFPVKTVKRLSRIDACVQGVLPPQCDPADRNEDGTADALIRSYKIEYDILTPNLSFLSRITRFGSTGDDNSYLPPITFSYSRFDPEKTLSAAGAFIPSENTPVSVVDSDIVEFIDMNRDGLPDMLKTDYHGGSHTCYFNQGMDTTGAVPVIKWADGKPVNSPYHLAAELYLAENSVHLADMDGDGISDLIHKSAFNDVFFHVNKGDGSWSDRKRMSIMDTAPPAPFGVDNARTADLDFDKRMDVMKSSENGYALWLNIGHGKYSREIRTAGASYQGQVIGLSDTGVHLADMNGDRISDVVKIRPSYIIVCANMGYGVFEEGITLQIPDTVLTDGPGGQVERAEFVDINGDGLADLVIERASPGELWYWLNLGTDALSQKYVITDMPTLYTPGVTTRWADMNGNGTMDLVYADSGAAGRLTVLDIGMLVTGPGHANLLTGIDNGLGVFTQIRYKSSTDDYIQAFTDNDPWETTIPFPVTVVSEVKVTTGLDLDSVPGTDEYVKHYSYRDGFYEDREKAFRGFGQVTVTETGDAAAPTGVTIHAFHTGGPDGINNDPQEDDDIDEISPEGYREEEALKGKVKGTQVQTEDGTVFYSEHNLWEIKNLAKNPDEIEIRFAQHLRNEKRIYEGNPIPETVQTDFLYDNYGNVIEEKKYGAVSISGDEAFTYTDYINDETRWILGLPRQVVLRNSSNEKISETINYYDGPDYTGLDAGQVEKGNLTRRQGWVQGTTYIDTIRYAHDTAGNITGSMDGNGNLRHIFYDPVFHIYPVSETIEVGGGLPDLSLTAAYNYGLGVITQSTDFNGHATAYDYDGFGRLVAIIRPGDTRELPTQRFGYEMADPRNHLRYVYGPQGDLALSDETVAASAVKTMAREISGETGTYDSILYSDGLGRTLARVEEAETGFVVKEAVLFNSKGTVHQAFLPFDVAVPDFQTPSPQAVAKTQILYDASGREILRVNPPDNDGVITESQTAYQPLNTIVTDENNHSRGFYRDGLDRLVKVDEHNQEETYTTVYTYDAADKLTTIADAQNNVKTLVYDGLGRMTEMNDPDAGKKRYVYDDAGNLIQTTDNKSQVIVFTYDQANRMLSEDYLDTRSISPDVAFHYDQASSDYPEARNVKGRLSWVKDLSGGYYCSYDSRGNLRWSVKRIADDTQVQDFKTQNRYDAMDRVTELIFPDGDTLSYTYNHRSLLESIPGIVNRIGYDASGRTASIQYANGVSTDYTYDPRQRLVNLYSASSLQAGKIIQDLSYTMDGAGNITQITDGRPIPQNMPQNATQTFHYDDLYRLIHARGPGYGAIDFGYDRIGNMISKQSPALPDPGHIEDPLINLGEMTIGGSQNGAFNRTGRLPGDPPGPHAVTSTQSGLAYDYDDNGNMISHAEGDIFAWDFRDRLVHSRSNTTDTRYVYDYNGQRVTRKVNKDGFEKTTRYISKSFEIRHGQAVKHIFAGRQRVAQIQGSPQFLRKSQTLYLYPGWNVIAINTDLETKTIADALQPINGLYSEIWTYDHTTGKYKGHVPSRGLFEFNEIEPQTAYFIKMTQSAEITFTGEKVTTDQTIHAGWTLIACPSDLETDIPTALHPIKDTYAAIWSFDAQHQAWLCHFPADHGRAGFLNTFSTMIPGNAYWIYSHADTRLPFAAEKEQFNFYHADHLGSTDAVTDESGIVVENTEFYPFGRARYEEQNGFDSAYKYTGKELDEESDLYYFEARYYNPVIGKFISIDPLISENTQDYIITPFRFNTYGYAFNNPILIIDKNGLDGELFNNNATSQSSSMDWGFNILHWEKGSFAGEAYASGSLPKGTGSWNAYLGVMSFGSLTDLSGKANLKKGEIGISGTGSGAFFGGATFNNTFFDANLVSYGSFDASFGASNTTKRISYFASGSGDIEGSVSLLSIPVSAFKGTVQGNTASDNLNFRAYGMGPIYGSGLSNKVGVGAWFGSYGTNEKSYSYFSIGVNQSSVGAFFTKSFSTGEE